MCGVVLPRLLVFGHKTGVVLTCMCQRVVVAHVCMGFEHMCAI
jgi:hypothetical protein